MTNSTDKIPDRANRTVAIWDAGLYPIPCLKTQAVGFAGTPGDASPPVGTYRRAVKDFLDIIAPVGGPRKCDVLELGNEPGQGSYPPGTDLQHYLNCLAASYDLIRARGLKVILGAMTNGATYTSGGTTLYGSPAVSRAITNHYRNTAWWMLDGFAIHIYKDDIVQVNTIMQNQRDLFPANLEMYVTENGWPTGAGGPFTKTYSEPMRVNRILDMWGHIVPWASNLNLRVWTWFANSDYGSVTTWDERCGLVNLAGVKKSGAAVTRPPGSMAAGEVFTRSWDALDWLPKTTTVNPDPPIPITPAAAVAVAPPRLLEAVKKSHTLALTAEVLRDGDVVATPTPTGGSVTYDARAAVRATLDLTLVDDGSLGWVPQAPIDPLAPYGNEIRVSRGVRYDDGTEDLVSLGIFRINELEAQDTGDGLELRLTGTDRAQSVSDAKFEKPHNVPRGTLFTDAITTVITAAIGQVETRFVETKITTPGLVAEEGEDRWEFAQGLATALGAELYFDSDGVLVLAPIPRPTDNPTAELVEGEGGVLLEASKRWSRTDAFNRVIVTAENSDVNPPVRATATDMNPLSPTYYEGSFGHAPRFYSNQFVTTQAQAQDTAEGILLAELGVTQQVDFGAVVNPTLRASDIVLVRRARIGISEAHIIDSLTIPLDAESSMTGQTRLVFPQMIETKPSHLLFSPETLWSSEQVFF